jgi:hypothetical protein
VVTSCHGTGTALTKQTSSPVDQAVDFIAFCQKQLGKVATVLPGNTGAKSLAHGTIFIESFVPGQRGRQVTSTNHPGTESSTADVKVDNRETLDTASPSRSQNMRGTLLASGTLHQQYLSG